jgi:hypothetical protein
MRGVTGETLNVVCLDGYHGGGTATCGADGFFNALVCEANTCTCTDGVAAVAEDGSCIVDGAEHCTACNDDAVLVDQVCAVPSAEPEDVPEEAPDVAEEAPDVEEVNGDVVLMFDMARPAACASLLLSAVLCVSF